MGIERIKETGEELIKAHQGGAGAIGEGPDEIAPEFKDVLIEVKALQWKSAYKKYCPIGLEEYGVSEIKIDEDGDGFGDYDACLYRDYMFENVLEDGDWIIQVNGEYMVLNNKEVVTHPYSNE